MATDEVTTNFDKTLNFLNKIKKKETVAVFMHNTPDPDALGAAYGIQWLLKKKRGFNSRIFYGGEISHPQNRTLLNILEIGVCNVNEFNKDDFEHVLVVDATCKNSDVNDADFVIDHHRVEAEVNDESSLVEHVGSTCTLVWELINKTELKFEGDADEAVATALFFGIRNDTNDLISETTTDRDFIATKELTMSVNRKKLSSIIDYSLPAYFFDLERDIHLDSNWKIEHSCFVGSVGIIAPTKRDSLPMLADKMVRREGIETALVFAIVGNDLQVSVRSKNSSLDVNSFCQKLFGREYAGGKLGSGGARVPLGIFSVEGLSDELRDNFWGALKSKLFFQILNVVKGN